MLDVMAGDCAILRVMRLASSVVAVPLVDAGQWVADGTQSAAVMQSPSATQNVPGTSNSIVKCVQMNVWRSMQPPLLP
jgi:hypothetical protein